VTAGRVPRVVVLSPTALVGGAERSLLELLRLTGTAIDVTVVVPGDGPLATAAGGAGARVACVPWPAALLGLGERARDGVSVAALLGAVPGVAAAVARLRAALAGLAPDVVVTNGIKAHVLGALARRPDVPLVWYGREGLEGRPRSSQLLRLLGRRCDAAIAISRYVGDELARVLPAGVPIVRLPNVVDVERFRPGQALPAGLAKPPGTLWFGAIGALTPLKGQDVFLEAAARIAGTLPSAEFLLVGSAQYATETHLDFPATLRRLAAERGLAGRVHFLGERSDVAAIVANLDVCVHPSRGPEGLGRAVLEAMASAVPVVTVDRWGPAELVRHGETGLTGPPGDVDTLAAHLTALGHDPALRRRLGDAGRRWVASHVDPQHIAARFLALVSQLAARRPGADPAVQLESVTGR
jgi:glycosyltransferase involved in cell wall biosynthesis